MKVLQDRIMQDGRALPGGILKVDSFLNHQMDPNLMHQCAQEFAKRFEKVKYNKIVTIESSGIAPALMLGYIKQLPVVFIKKKQPSTMDNNIVAKVHSFTMNRDYTVCISRSYLTSNDHVLFIDDFLAYGNAATGMIELAKQVGATIEGMGFVIEKGFQGGSERLRKLGMKVESLAIVDSLDNGKITLRK